MDKLKTANFSRSTVSGTFNDFDYQFTDNDWLISIRDKGARPATIGFKFGKVLHVSFEDTEHPRHGIHHPETTSIAEFIRLAKNQKKNLWVNCHAGKSRSGAIVELLSRLGWEIQEHMCSQKRRPNRLVFSRLSRYFPEITKEDIDTVNSMITICSIYN